MYTIIALVCMCDVFCMNMRRLSCVNAVCCMYTQSYEIVLYKLLQGSWELKLIDRVYNVEKKRKRHSSGGADEPPPKKRGRPRKNDDLHTRYPTVQEESLDEVTERNTTDAIEKELEKEKPRKDTLMPLMKSLFSSRRNYILHEADSVNSTLLKFPALKMPIIVCFSHRTKSRTLH